MRTEINTISVAAILLLGFGGLGNAEAQPMIQLPQGLVGLAPFFKDSDASGHAMLTVFQFLPEGVWSPYLGLPLVASLESRAADGEVLDSQLVAPLELSRGYANVDLAGLKMGETYGGQLLLASDDCQSDETLCFEDSVGVINFIELLPAGSTGPVDPAPPVADCTTYTPAFPSHGADQKGYPYVHSPTTSSASNTGSASTGYARAGGGDWQQGRARVFGGWFYGSPSMSVTGDVTGDVYADTGAYPDTDPYVYAHAVVLTAAWEHNSDTNRYRLLGTSYNAGYISVGYGAGKEQGPMKGTHNPTSLAGQGNPAYTYNGQLYSLAYSTINGSGGSASATADADFNSLKFCSS